MYKLYSLNKSLRLFNIKKIVFSSLHYAEAVQKFLN